MQAWVDESSSGRRRSQFRWSRVDQQSFHSRGSGVCRATNSAVRGSAEQLDDGLRALRVRARLVAEFLERALAIFEREYGRDHVNVAYTLMSLGTAHGDIGDAAKQRELLERALAITDREFGRDHAYAVFCRSNSGGVRRNSLPNMLLTTYIRPKRLT